MLHKCADHIYGASAPFFDTNYINGKSGEKYFT